MQLISGIISDILPAWGWAATSPLPHSAGRRGTGNEKEGNCDTQVTYKSVIELLRASNRAGVIVSYLDGARRAWT